jgi:hypothetical protein
LGYTWLVEFDPKINWKDGVIEGQPCEIMTANDNIRYHLACKLAQNNQINKVSISQEWANKEKRHQEEVEIPDKYKRHAAVFSEEGAK